jgi:L-threonylcarbamoyladenylate synthase
MGINFELQRCINILKNGGLIVAPTDTVYGLLCDATNESAVQKLIKVKNRPWGKPISVFVDGFKMMETLVETKHHKKMLKNLLPGPFTIILPSKHSVSSLLESERNTLGVRFPSFSWIQKLVHLYAEPLTATSANISGRPPHYEPKGFIGELSKEKRNMIDYVIDRGRLPRNKPSTIIDLTGNSSQLLRQGDIIPVAEHRFTSKSAQETKKTAEFLIEKYAREMEKKPLVFILEGEMGVGKTVFAQGLGQYLGIEHVVSPTYVVYYEYPINNEYVKMFLHADLFNIEENEEFSHLGIENYLKPQTVICIEWGNKIGPIFEKIKKLAHVVVIEMRYASETERSISVKDL